MSSTDGQPPLTRRQVRDLERAREAGEAITGSISIVSGSPVPSSVPISSVPISSVTESLAESKPRAEGAPDTSPAPGSVALPGQLTRRELRALRESQAPEQQTPVPLRAPKPTTAQGGRELSDALSHVADIANGTPAPVVAPREAERVDPPVDEDDDIDDEVALDLPAPRSSAVAAADGRPAGGRAGLSPEDAAALEDTIERPGPRRRGSVSEAANRASSEAVTSASSQRIPAPSSVPGIFPFPIPTSDAVEGPADAAPASPRSPAPSAETLVPPSSTSHATEVQDHMTSGAAAEPSTGESRATDAAAAEADIAAPPAAAPAAPVLPRIPASVPAAEDSSAASTPATAGVYVPPVGHWSMQADRDDDDHVTGTGSHFGLLTGQQNAIILGDDRLPDVTGALNATGEVIITGSIDLPRSLAATGSHHIQRIDGADIDRMLEEGDSEAGDSEATPVRASRAVSANTSTRQVVLAGGKPKTSRLPIVAGIVSGVVGFVIVGLVIVGFVTGVL